MFSRLAILLVLMFATTSEAQPAGEYQVKAAFLFNFAKFVEWPAKSFNGLGDSIRLCVLGDNPFGTALVDVIAGKRINDRSLLAVRLVDAKDAGRCQVLFVSKPERKNLRPIMAMAESNGILTVGDWDNFALDGGMIGFRLDDGKVRLEINLKAAEQAQVQISSKLLNLAQIVKK
jgi:hypothetical protein